MIVRNRIGLHHAAERSYVSGTFSVDEHFEQLADALEQAYYGQWDAEGMFIPNTGWRDGVSVDWNGIDLSGLSPAQRKAGFDLLHGAIHHAHVIVLDEIRIRLGLPDPPVNPNPDPDRPTIDRIAEARAYFASMPAARRDKVLSAIRARGFDAATS